MKKYFSLFLIYCMLFSTNMPAFAAAPNRVATSGNKTWGSSGAPVFSTLVSQAQSTNNLDLHGQVVTVKNNGTAYDGTVLGNKNIFSIGNITDSLGSASSAFVSTTASANNLTVDISSININGSMTVSNRNSDDASNATNVTGSLDVGGPLGIINLDDGSDVNVGLTVGGDFTSWGDVWLVADTGATGADATLTLNGTNNFFISSGVSLFDSGDGRAILTFSGASDQIVTGVINGGGDNNGILNVYGAGDTIFDDNIGSTYSLRELSIASAATKTAEFDGTVDAGIITMSGDGTAQFDAAVTATNLYLNSTGTTTLNAASAITTTRLNDAATLGLNATLTGNINNNGNLLTVLTTGTGQVNGAISGTGGLTKTGAGTLTLSGTNTYTGTTTINAGTLFLTSSKAIINTGTVALANVAGAKLRLGVNKTIGALSGGGALGGNVDLQSHTLTVGGSSTTTYAGAISGTGGLTKSGTGTLTLSGTNTYTGTTTINKGALVLSGGAAIADTGSIVLANASGTTLRVNSNESIGFLSGGGTTGGNVVLQGGVRLSLLGDGSAKTYAGIISGAGSLLKTGTSTLMLTGANTYSNGTILDEGTLVLGNNSALGTGDLWFTDDATVQSDDNARSISNTIDLLGHNPTISGSYNLDLQGVVWDSVGGGQLIVDMNSDSNTLALYGNNTYDGGTVLNQGQIYLGHDNALGTGDLTLGGNGGLRSGSDTRLVANNIDLDGNNLTVAGVFDLGLSGDISDTSGGGSLTVDMEIASGALTLSGANVAIENTYLNSGNLALDTDLTGDVKFLADSTVTVADGYSITGAVDNASLTTGQGTLALLGGNQAISGNIGGSSALKTVNIGAGLGETAVFGGSINAQTINITSTGTAAFAKSVVGNINFADDGIARLATGEFIDGDITNSISGKGTLTLLGAHDIMGNIGSNLLGNNGLKLVTVGNGLVTIDGDVRALAVNFADDNELRMSAGHGIMGTVTTTVGGRGTLTFLGATSTGGDIGQAGSALKVVNFNGATSLSNDIYAANTYIKSGSTVTMTGDTTVTGNLTLNNAADAVLDLGLRTLDLAGTGRYTQNANSKLMIALSDADWGRISAGGIATISALSTLEVDVSGLLTSGREFTIVDAAAGGSIGDLTVTWDSPLFHIRKSISAEDLIIHVTRYRTYAQMANNANAAAVARVLDSLVLTATGDMQNVLGQLDDMESSQQISNALDSMTPVVDGGQTTVTNEALNKFVSTAMLRLQDSKIEEDEKDRNLLLYNASRRNDIWVQGYGDYVHQGKRELSNGYRAKIWGSVLGIDRLFMDGELRLGLAQGFGSSKIRSKDNYGRTSINSYQTALYGEYQGRDKPYIFDAVLSYGYNDYDSSRHVSVGAINRTARSEYNGQQFSSYFETGYKFKKNNFDIIPLLALDYTYLYLSDYMENGAGALNLTVNSHTYNSLKPGIGCRLSRAFETKSGIFTPELRFRYFYDVLNDAQETVASFAGGGTSFRTTGYKPAPSSFNLGARLEFFNKKNITVLADCNTVLKNDYYEVGGSLTFKYSF